MPSEDPPAIAVPYQQLSPTALRGVVESFVLREGTDYGSHEFTLDEKVAHVMQQLARGEARVMFDPVAGSVDIVRATAPGRRGADALES
jgi:uncharacterized protein YheU (UPF0270 family)